MSISFCIKPLGDSQFPQKSPCGQFPFISSGIELPLLIWPLNYWSDNVSGCKEAWHPCNRVCVCVCVGRCREESILKLLEMILFRSSLAISAEHWTEVPSSPTVSLASRSSCCHLPGQLSVKVVCGGGGASLYGSSPTSLLRRSFRAVSVGGEFANFLLAQEGMYINIIKCLISEAAVFCWKASKPPDSCLS